MKYAPHWLAAFALASGSLLCAQVRRFRAGSALLQTLRERSLAARGNFCPPGSPPVKYNKFTF
jgi:hypothetical protein